MRRNLQSLPAEQIQALLEQAQVLRLALSVDDQPYIVPVSYGFTGDKIYLHGAETGRKMELLQANSRVCFEVEGESTVMRTAEVCNWSIRYSSVIGFGQARIVTDPVEQKQGLDAIVRHYGGEPADYPASSLSHLAVIAIDIEEMTGKVDSDSVRHSRGG